MNVDRFVLRPTPVGWEVWDRQELMVVDDGPDSEAEELVSLARAIMNSLHEKLNRQ